MSLPNARVVTRSSGSRRTGAVVQNRQAMFTNLRDMSSANPWMLAELLFKAADRLPGQNLVATATRSLNLMHAITHSARELSETRECSSQKPERGLPVARAGIRERRSRVSGLCAGSAPATAAVRRSELDRRPDLLRLDATRVCNANMEGVRARCGSPAGAIPPEFSVQA